MDNKFLDILKSLWGYESFRPLQLEAIKSVFSGCDTLVLMPTGGGKSVVYQVPGLASEGVCIVVTPLISLMKDQVDKLKKRKILAEAIHSGVPAKDIDRILDNCVWGDIKFLYISPERIESDMFRARFSKMKVSLITVDEAHCISQWGYDFRPSYLYIARLRALQPDVPILALTASATPGVADDIREKLLFKKPKTLSMSFARPNLSYIVRRTEDKNQQLLRIVGSVAGQGIVYVRTREKSETLAAFMTENGISATFYHGGLNYRDRTEKQDLWTRGKVRIIAATNAFGMGIDKPDVRFVIHYDICDSLEEYYQEAGRAGRDGLPSYAVILVSDDDAPRASKRVSNEYPPVDTIKSIYEKVCNHLQIGFGEGKEMSYAFNIFDFCSRERIFTPVFVNAMKILQQNGYMVLTEESDIPTRIRFMVSRDQLYRVRVERQEVDYFITVILRRYTGVFSDFVAVSEDELAHLSGYTTERIGELLKTLSRQRIIRYIPSNREPRIFMSEERLPLQDLRISPESHRMRREQAVKRIESVFRYISDDECRSLVIQRYFGEKAEIPCGSCDVCRERRRNDPQPIRDSIVKLLSSGPATVKEIVKSINKDQDSILRAVEDMIAEGTIAENNEEKLFLRR